VISVTAEKTEQPTEMFGHNYSVSHNRSLDQEDWFLTSQLP